MLQSVLWHRISKLGLDRVIARLLQDGKIWPMAEKQSGALAGHIAYMRERVAQMKMGRVTTAGISDSGKRDTTGEAIAQYERDIARFQPLVVAWRKIEVT